MTTVQPGDSACEMFCCFMLYPLYGIDLLETQSNWYSQQIKRIMQPSSSDPTFIHHPPFDPSREQKVTPLTPVKTHT